LELTQLQQGFATDGMGSNSHFAQQQSSGPNVRFGSKADNGALPIDIRFTPKSGHQNWLGLRSAQQLRQLGDIRRDPPRLILRALVSNFVADLRH
jgi:hypothetical protein